MTKKEMIIDVLEHLNWGSEERFYKLVNRALKKDKSKIEKIYNYHLIHTTEDDYKFCSQLLID